MAATRENHYVPQWYQRGFLDDGRATLTYLDLRPEIKHLPDGRSVRMRDRFDWPTSRCFYVTDLYSTFFGGAVNDEIERLLFGRIDSDGARAVRAFIGDDLSEWRDNFTNLFEYIDTQKLRTPKGLNWLKGHYPSLVQNELMEEMQGVRNMHCALWAEGVREIVSAEDADIKFIVTDHPVTVYNHAIPPDSEQCAYPIDPPIELKASQTLFSLNKDFCLILSNLEYAKNPDLADPCAKRTFPKRFRSPVVRTDAFIRKRKLSDAEVAHINFVLKSRARRHIAAGRKDWLDPERHIGDAVWADLRRTLLPPRSELFGFGGEMFARLTDGTVYYQDQFGRTESPRDFLRKQAAEGLNPPDPCGCGSGRKHEQCCMGKPADARPSWTELSVRERNIMLLNGVMNVLEVDGTRDWVEIRRSVTDEKISKVYSLYEALWPLETDLLALLPKPDSRARAVFTGDIDPPLVTEFMFGAPLYFDEVIVQSPFQHPGVLQRKYSPVHNPGQYRTEFLKSVFVLWNVMPLIELGAINLIPDPCCFDFHLRRQMWSLAQRRSAAVGISMKDDPRTTWAHAGEWYRSMLAMPVEMQRSQIQSHKPGVEEPEIEALLQGFERLKERDPLVVLQEDAFAGGKDGGQLWMLKLAPNFEITMFLARATGSFIITDSSHRWGELLAAQHLEAGTVTPHLSALTKSLGGVGHCFVNDVETVAKMRLEGHLRDYRALIEETFVYAQEANSRGSSKSRERQIAARFRTVHRDSQREIRNSGAAATKGRLRCIFPKGGIEHNNVSRMLLTAGVDHRLDTVPMAFFMDRPDPGVYNPEDYVKSLLYD